MNTLKRVVEHAIPFLMIGTLIAVGFAIFLFLAHMLLWGLLIGLVLYVLSAIKQRFFTKQTVSDQPGARIIDHESQ